MCRNFDGSQHRIIILNKTCDVSATDTSLKDGLFHEFKKHGKVTSVQIHGASEERYGLVFFRQQEDQEKALGASKGKLFFGMQIDVTAWNGPGMVLYKPVSQQRSNHWHCTWFHGTFIFQRLKVRMSFVLWMRGSMSFIQRPLGHYLLETWRRPPLTTTSLTSFSALAR